MMGRELVQTADGSHSLYVPALNERYHSRHGAIQESSHVFVDMGFRPMADGLSTVKVLEMGFGTGLNALLTALEAMQLQVRVEYWAVEAYPLHPEEVEALNYPHLVGGTEAGAVWESIHAAPWNARVEVCPQFCLTRLHTRMEGLALEERVHLVYFDAFAPEKQPELWTEAMFQNMRRHMEPGGRLTTYCAKGAVRRVMQAAGFQVQKVKGPPGKREMLIAIANA